MRLMFKTRRTMHHMIWGLLIALTLGTTGAGLGGYYLGTQHPISQDHISLWFTLPRGKTCPSLSSPKEQTRSIDLSTLAGTYQTVVFAADAYDFTGIVTADTQNASLTRTIGFFPTTAIPYSPGTAPYAFLTITNGDCRVVDIRTAQSYMKTLTAVLPAKRRFSLTSWDATLCPAEKGVSCYLNVDLEFSEDDIVEVKPNQVELFFGSFVLYNNLDQYFHGLLLVGSGFNDHHVRLWHFEPWNPPKTYDTSQTEDLQKDFCGQKTAPYFPNNGDVFTIDVPGWALTSVQPCL